MKRYISILSVLPFLLLTACHSHTIDSRTQLLMRLDTLAQHGCMFGHQDDPLYGVHWRWESGRSDVLESCGDYPAVMGFDLGGIEMGDSVNLDSVPFDRMREEIIAHHRRGGIVTLSWHPRNPVTGGSAWDVSEGVVSAVLQPGEVHDRFVVWHQRVDEFLSSLISTDGQPIPIIFRPWHENNGRWFWWGEPYCTPAEYKALWDLTFSSLKVQHSTSLLWCYSPNLQGGFTDSLFLSRYPGDDCVDIIGLDAYQWGTEAEYIHQTGVDLTYLCQYGQAHHKPVALTECGRRSMPDPAWWNTVLLPLIRSHQLTYALVWRNSDMEEHFGPIPDTSSAEEFRTFYADPSILFLGDIAPSPFVRQQGGAFVCDGKPYSYIGTNVWYGAILASQGQGGNRSRLIAELDTLQSLGITNLRILVGSDGERGVATKVEPTLQVAPGEYNDTILDGLDWLLYQMGKRGMKAVLYLNNAWEWSGGYGYYLEQAGLGHTPRPEEVGYEAYMHYVAQFSTSERAQQLFYDYVRFVVSRQNRYSHIAYADDPAIMAWQIGNEPRAFGDAEKQPFAQWLSHASALIRSLDPNHLISVGSEGIWGCEMDSALYRQISADPNIDYLTAHIWPYNWGWVHPNSLLEELPGAIRNTDAYLRPHIAIANDLRKPLVIEEFGFPRDAMALEKTSSVEARNIYYRHIFSLVRTEPAISGCNFWAWGGYAAPQHAQWQLGDDYTGDPAQEPQGLNSVFITDTTTLSLITRP